MSLFDVLRTTVASLDEAGIPHMVAGSVASSHHGEPRSTQDIDLVIDPSPEALDHFVANLDPSESYVGDARRALADRSQFNVVSISTGWKIDLIIRQDRPFSRSEFERRQAVDLGGVRVHLATSEDTILAKLEWGASSGSERQLNDVDGIIRAQRDALDTEYLDRWAGELGLGPALRDALRRAMP